MFEKKMIISVIAVFVLTMAGGFLIHGWALNGDYTRLGSLMRSEDAAHKLFGLMFLADFLFACGVSWIYIRGKEAKPWLGQGVRYGIAVALVAVIPMYLIYYVVMPFPSDLVVKQIVFETIEKILLGIAVAWINR
jgi:hypothetical protein